MASTQVTPTRMELTRTKKKLVTAIKGHKLLKDKRDELMRQFLDLVKVNMELREKVEAGIRSANKNFVIAKAGMDEATLNTALMAPKQEVDLEVGQKNVMSVDIPVFETKTRTADANDIYSYGFAFTSSDLDGAVKSLADILQHPASRPPTPGFCRYCQIIYHNHILKRNHNNKSLYCIVYGFYKNLYFSTFYRMLQNPKWFPFFLRKCLYINVTDFLPLIFFYA